MANWEKFRENMGRTANKAAVKAGELGDSMKLRYKLHRAKGELTELYEKLGRITYDQLHYSHDHAAPQCRRRQRRECCVLRQLRHAAGGAYAILPRLRPEAGGCKIRGMI